MRKRLKNFLPVALIALIVQIFAPIGAWSAANIAAGPSAAAVVCHGNNTPGSDQSDQTTHNRVHDGCCLVCSVLHTGAPVDPRSPDLIVAFDRNAVPVIWHSLVFVGAIFDGGYPARARASIYFLTEQIFEQPVQVFAPISAVERAGQSLVSGSPMFRPPFLGTLAASLALASGVSIAPGSLSAQTASPLSGEVKDLRRETSALKEVVADLTLENRLLKKSMNGDGEDEA